MFPVYDKDGKLIAAFASFTDARDWRQYKLISETIKVAPSLSSDGRREVMERQDALTPEEVQTIKEAYQPVHDAILQDNDIFGADVEYLLRSGMYVNVVWEELHGPTLREMEREAAAPTAEEKAAILNAVDGPLIKGGPYVLVSEDHIHYICPCGAQIDVTEPKKSCLACGAQIGDPVRVEWTGGTEEKLRQAIAFWQGSKTEPLPTGPAPSEGDDLMEFFKG